MEKRMKKKMGKGKKILIVLLVLVLVVGGVAGGVTIYTNNLLKELKRTELKESSLNIFDDPTDIMWQYHNDVKNFALFGIDARKVDRQSRSDVMMIVSVNYTAKTIKLVSLQRDTYVPKYTKFCHAYFYAGPQGALSCINSNLQMNLDDFVTVNFFGVAEIIDQLGGIEIEISEAERVQINRNLIEQARIGLDGTNVTESGKVRLNGSQSVAYARIRAIDSDFARGNRQRKVIMAAVQSLKNVELSGLDELLRVGMGACLTSFTNTEIVDLATWALTNVNDITFESASLPGTLIGYSFARHDGLSCVEMNMPRAINALKSFLYDLENEDVPVPIVRDEPGQEGENQGTENNEADPAGSGE